MPHTNVDSACNRNGTHCSDLSAVWSMLQHLHELAEEEHGSVQAGRAKVIATKERASYAD